MNFLILVIAGLSVGSIYSLAGVGLVLTYKTSGIFNFAHGSIATVAAFLFYTLREQLHMPALAAAALVLIVGSPIIAILFELLARVVALAPMVIRVVSTVGVLLIVQAAIVLIYGQTTVRNVPAFLPTRGFTIGKLVITEDRIIVFVLVAVVTALLALFLRRARVGTAMRAVVGNPSLLDCSGTSPVAVRRIAWIIGVAFAVGSGILLSAYISLDATVLTLLVVQAFGAAAIGSFSSLPMTYVGGLVIGVASSLCTGYLTTGVLSGLSSSVPFLILFIVVLITRKPSLSVRRVSLAGFRSAWSAPLRLQALGVIPLIVLLVFVPEFAGVHLTDWTVFLAMTIVFMSLGLLARTSGQVSLCHVGFMAIGAVAFSHLSFDHHWPWLLGLVVSGLIAVPIGAVLAIPAIRLSSLYLALATFGFGILLSTMFYTASFMFGSLGLGLTEVRPELSWFDGSNNKNFYYLVLLVAALVTIGVVALGRTRLGRLLHSLADSPTGLATTGTSVNVTRVVVFCLSAFLAAIGGALAGDAQGLVSANSYPPLLSLSYFAVVIITVGGEPWYALVAAAGVTLIPSYFSSSNTTNYLQLIFGLGAVLYAVTPDARRGVPQAVQRLADQLAALLPRPPLRRRRDERQPARSAVTSARLEVTGLSVRFGGLVAVNDVSLDAATGRIVGLIGPNGAGKTSFFNACSGLNRPASGQVRLDGVDLSRSGPSLRARLGIGRTFQQMELFDSRTVRQNVALGCEGAFAGFNPLSHVFGTRKQRREVEAATQECLSWCGIGHIADRPAGSLSTGQRRLVELARCLAGSARIVLLDEPSSGLDRRETELFGQILRRAVDERGIGIVIVEHDMSLVSTICDYIYVLDFGQLLYRGEPADVLTSAVVRSAYLGEDDPNPGSAGRFGAGIR